MLSAITNLKDMEEDISSKINQSSTVRGSGDGRFHYKHLQHISTHCTEMSITQ